MLTADDARVEMDNGTWLCLKVREPAMAKAFVLNRSNGLYDVDIKPHREKRSLDANAYYWKLCGELAEAINEEPERIYRRHIRDVGNYEVLCIQERALDTFRRTWTSGHLGRFVETKASKLPGCVTVLAYYGSSDFDKSQMSRLIDNCIQDCKALGIETLSDRELSLLREEWGHG